MTPSRAERTATLIACARDYLSASYPGPGFTRTGAICPYVSRMVAEDKMNVLLAEGVDGTDYEPVLRAALEAAGHALRTIAPGIIDTALVLGFPDLPDDRAEDLLNRLEEALVKPMLAVHMMVATTCQVPGSSPEDPWPKGASSPMPTLVLRRLGPWDAVFMQSEHFARTHHGVYLDWYLTGRMTPQNARTFEEMCARHDLPLVAPA